MSTAVLMLCAWTAWIAFDGAGGMTMARIQVELLLSAGDLFDVGEQRISPVEQVL
jgi:hypothetical protein